MEEGRTKGEQGKYSFNGFFTASRCFLFPLSGNGSSQHETQKSRKRKKQKKLSEKHEELRDQNPDLICGWVCVCVRGVSVCLLVVNACACALVH